MLPETLSVSELASEVGQKVRTIQFWADAGVLRPVSETAAKGKGTHRRFPKDELLFGKVATKLAAMNSPIGEIAWAVGEIRKLNASGDPTAGVDAAIAEVLELRSIIDDDHPIRRRELALRWIKAINYLGLAGGFRGNVDLSISYYLDESGIVQSRLMFWEGSSRNAELAHFDLERVIGIKIVRLDAERELRSFPVSEEHHKFLRQVFSTSLMFLAKLAVLSTRKDAAESEETAP